MKDVNEVLKQKQQQLAMVKREVEALELVIAMLKDDDSRFGERPIRPPEEPPKKGWP